MPEDHLQAAREAIERSVVGLNAETIARPVPGRWSIGEILEHLTLAFSTNASWLEKALASGELRARAPRLPERLARMLVVEIGYFPRANAPEMTRPSSSIPPEQSVGAILSALDRLDATLARVSARFGDHVRVANHPYFAGLTVPQWRKFHWRHTVHHMRQVRERRRD
jgi:DinB family protein